MTTTQFCLPQCLRTKKSMPCLGDRRILPELSRSETIKTSMGWSVTGRQPCQLLLLQLLPTAAAAARLLLLLLRYDYDDDALPLQHPQHDQCHQCRQQQQQHHHHQHRNYSTAAVIVAYWK